MSEISIKVEKRLGKGRHSRRELAQKGLIPGVICGKGMESISIAVDETEIEKVIHEFGTSMLIELTMAGDEKKSCEAIVKDLQFSPLNRKITNVDFQKVDMQQKLKVEVPIKLTGTPQGVKDGGTLQQQERFLEVECLPGEMPEFIMADISHLKVGESLCVADLEPIKGSKFLADADTVISSIMEQMAEETADKEGENLPGSVDAVKPVTPKGE